MRSGQNFGSPKDHWQNLVSPYRFVWLCNHLYMASFFCTVSYGSLIALHRLVQSNILDNHLETTKDLTLDTVPVAFPKLVGTGM